MQTMGIRESHGVVIVYYGVNASGDPPGWIHRPGNACGGVNLMASDRWELFPSKEVAEEAEHIPCGTCYPDNGGRDG